MAWDEVQERLASARTPEERRLAAAVLMRHIAGEHLDKHLVIMQKGGVHAIRLSELHLAMQHEPTYNMIRKIVAGR